MPPRKRAAQADDAQQLPVREKRRKTTEATENSNLEESLSHIDEPIAKRALRSSHKDDVSIRLDEHGSPEIAQSGGSTTGPKKSYVKFGSESPPRAPVEERETEVLVGAEQTKSEDEDSDDDEEPEAVSHSQAEAQSKAAQAQEARLLKQREQDERDRRRKRDAQLKAQVKSSEKRRNGAELNGEDADDEAEERHAKGSIYDANKLPEFLPEELLAAEAPARPPTPPPTAPKGNAKRFVDALHGRQKKEKPPADVICKGKKIRVLQSHNTLLPPKANTESANIRERWMQGRASFQKVDKRGTNAPAVRRRAGPQAFI